MSIKNPQVLAIIGQGYVGFPLAMAAVDAGWTVIGVDVNSEKVSQINAGSSPVEGVNETQLQEAIARDLYSATTDYSQVARASVITICVPTPLDNKREPDLELLRSAVASVAKHVSNETLIVNESTSYPGTLREFIMPLFNSLKLNNAMTIYFASAPERVNPGDLVWNQKNTPRLVGAINAQSQSKALNFYNSICSEVISVLTPEIAEAAKLLENTFRLVNIALINEFAQLCNASGLNVNSVIEAASSKPYGFMSFKPGVGVGGHCIPVDPLYLTWWARQNGSKASLVETADLINRNMPKHVAIRALSLINTISRKPRVLILGVAYKAGVSDVRESPVSELRDYLLENGVDVAWYDPLVSSWQGVPSVDLNWDCDLAILATNQPGMNLKAILDRGVQVLDCTDSLTGLKGVISL
jgi:UDP-N-acetyl-D-glucosamine dehydrogenase